MDILSKLVGAIRGLKSSFIEKPIQSGQNAIQQWAQSNPQPANKIINLSQQASQLPNQFVQNVKTDWGNMSQGKMPNLYTQPSLGSNLLTQARDYGAQKGWIPMKTYKSGSYTERGVDVGKIVDSAVNTGIRLFPGGQMALRPGQQSPLDFLRSENKFVMDKLNTFKPGLGNALGVAENLIPPVFAYNVTQQIANAPGETSAILNNPKNNVAQKAGEFLAREVAPLLAYKYAPKIAQKLIPEPTMQAINTIAGPAIIQTPGLMNLFTRAASRGGTQNFLLNMALAIKDGTEKQLDPKAIAGNIIMTAPAVFGMGAVLGTGMEGINLSMGNTKYSALSNYNKNQAQAVQQFLGLYGQYNSKITPVGGEMGTQLTTTPPSETLPPAALAAGETAPMRTLITPPVAPPQQTLITPPPVTPSASVIIPSEPMVPQSASNMQVGITSAQPANPAVADILKAGNTYFEQGNVDAGLAKLHEVTLQTKPEIQQLLSSDGASTINNLDTNTHGLYFGNPEPSFWLNLDTTDINKTAASIAQFAKTHKQDSFITATPSVNPNASFGFKMSIGQPLPNQDILTIEKVFNDNGIGLTLNQKTGEGYAMNIKEFDGMTPEQFHTAYIKIRLALSQLGINAKFILDKYDVKVYNNSTYDKLISNSIQSGRGNQAGERTAQAGGAIDRGAINETRLNTGNIPPQISQVSQEKVTPPPSVYTGQQKESQFINTLKENQTIPTDLTSNLSSKYDMTSDQGRKDYGLAAAQQDIASAYQRVINGVGDANELNGLTYGVTKMLQAKAHEARLADNIEMYRVYQNQFEQAAIAYQKRVSPAAQTVQFSHVFKYTTPDGIIDMVKDIFNDANDIRNLSVGRVVKALSGKTWKVEFTPAKEQYVRDQMKDIVLLPDAERIQATKSLINEVTKDIPIPVMNLIDAYRYQNALSGWRTHMRNVVSNVFNSSIVKPVRLLDMAAWDLLKSTVTGKPRTNSFREIPIYYRGLFGSVKEATNVFMDTFQNGTALGKSDIPVDEFRTNLSQIMMARTPKILTVAGRALEAADQFFVTLTSNAEYLRLKSKGVDESVARKMALDFSKYILYKNPLDLQNTTSQGLMMTKIDQFTNWLMKMRNTVPPPLNWFVMFLRVPMDVAKMSASYHPLTSMAALPGITDPTKRAEQWSNVRVGAAIALLGAAAAIAGKTTWVAPTDAKLKSAFYDTGRKPFSFAVDTPAGRVWVPFAYLGPWALSYGMGAAYQHYFADSKTAMTDSTAQKVGSLLTSSLNQWSQSTPLAGLGGFVRTVQGDIDYNVINNLSFTAGQMMPLNSLMGNIAAVVDPTFRRPKGFIQGLQKNIPWASTGLEPITDSLGQPAQRNISDYVLPYTLGPQNNIFEQQYQGAKLLQQQSSEANFYQKMADNAGGTVAGTTSSGTGGTKVLSTQKGNLDKLYETYDTITDPATRDKIKKSITDRGVNFDTGYENYLMKDTKVKQQGLSPAAQATLQRSNEYAFIKVLRNKYDGTGIGEDTLAAEMKKKNISQADLEYDDKTALPDDIQLEEIKAGITGLSYDDMLTKLVSYRKVSEGTRKALLTDTLVNTLNKDGLIDKSTAAWLKSTEWDAKTKSFKQAPAGGKSSKALPKIKFPKPIAYKFKAPQISGTKLTPVKLPPSYKSLIRKSKALKTGKFKRTALKLPAIPTPKSTLASFKTQLNG